MADVFVRTTGGNAAPLHATALDLKLRWYLLRNNIFRQFVDTYPVDPSYNYRTITLTMHGELGLATTPLDEIINPDSVDIPATRQVSVTMNEYGNTMKHTLLSRETSWDQSLPDELVFMLAENAAATIDDRVRNTLDGASNVFYVDNTGALTATAPTTFGTSGSLSAKAVSAAVANLRQRRVRPKTGLNFAAVIHPNVAFDLRQESGANVWFSPHAYSDPAEIYNGVVATFAGADFIESREVGTDTVSTPTTTRYISYFVGAEALLEASAIEPHIIEGPIVDTMKRVAPVSWHALLGWSIFRQNSIQLVKTITTNAVAPAAGSFDPKA